MELPSGSTHAASGIQGQVEPSSITLKVELGGGLETLFADAKFITLDLQQPFSIRHLISELATHVRPSSALGLFCSPGPEWDIKPGILPLINDEDWELLEPSGMEALLKEGDSVLFISTLHGG